MLINLSGASCSVKLQKLKSATQQLVLFDTAARLQKSFFLLIPAALILCNVHAQYKATTGEERLKDMRQRKEMEMRSMVKDVKFRNIGPTIMSGRVVDIDANPNDPTEFYVAYATGGLWHTVNNGLSFTPIFDNNDNIFMGDIAVDWKTKTIWVGTGEVNSSRSSYAGTGIYKSKDNGNTWEYLGLPESQHIGKILLHPTDPNTVWVAVMGHLYSFNKERGVYKTTDGGKTWKQTLAVDDHTGAIDMDIDPSHPDIVYASMWYRTRTAWNFEEGGKTSGIYKSTDGGNNWVLLSKAGSGLPTGDSVGRMGVAVYAKNPQIVYAIADNQAKKPNQKKDSVTDKLTIRDFKNLTKEKFAVLDDKKVDSFLKANRFPAGYTAASIKEKVAGGTFKPTVIYDYLKGPNDDLLDASAIIGCEVYRSDDAGATWKKTNEKDLNFMYNTYGYYFGKIWISPVNPDKVVITGVPVMLSADGGKTFKNINGANVHSDHHAIWINPAKDSHMINGNDGGVNITYDDGKVWYKANSVAAGQFYSIEVDDAKPYNVYGGLQDNGVWYGPSASNTNDAEWFGSGETSFKIITGGDGMMVQVDTRDNATMYAGSQFGAYARSNKNNEQRKQIRPRHQLGETPLRYNWEAPILLSKHNQDVFYMGSNRFHRSLNKADTMINLSGDLTKGGKPGDVPYGTLSWIAESPLKFGLLYAGSDDGLVHISKDGGYTWANISGATTRQNKKTVYALPQDLWVNCINASAFKESRVYLALSGYRYDHFKPYLFVSEDYGTTWSSVNGNLPAETINTVKEDPKNENILYVGTDQGLYVSIDRGKNYMPFTGGLPRVAVHDIAIQKRENEIVLGTHGRSIYIAKLDDVQRLLTDKEYYDKKKSAADKVTAMLTNTDKKKLLQKEGIDKECPKLKK
jgi:photosystem II stability/assembly factor-like uncharacterized protein